MHDGCNLKTGLVVGAPGRFVRCGACTHGHLTKCAVVNRAAWPPSQPITHRLSNQTRLLNDPSPERVSHPPSRFIQEVFVPGRSIAPPSSPLRTQAGVCKHIARPPVRVFFCFDSGTSQLLRHCLLVSSGGYCSDGKCITPTL